MRGADLINPIFTDKIISMVAMFVWWPLFRILNEIINMQKGSCSKNIHARWFFIQQNDVVYKLNIEV